MRYIVTVTTFADDWQDEDGERTETGKTWYEAEADSVDSAIRAVVEALGGGPLGADTEVSAFPRPDHPIRITRLASMTEFEAEFRDL